MSLWDKVRDKSDSMYNNMQDSVNQHLKKPKLDMYKPNDMQYKVKDSTFRDIYERGNETEGDSRWFVYMIPLLGVFLIQFVALVLIPAVGVAATGTNYFWFIISFYWLPLNGWVHSILSVGLSFAAYYGLKVFAEKYWASQHIDSSRELLDQYPDDAHLQQPEELPENYNIMGDGGIHSKHVDVTAILGYMHLNNDGLKKIEVTLRADGKTDLDEEGNVLNKNVVFYDDDDEVAKVMEPMMDYDFGERLWDSSGIPKPRGKNAAYIKQVLRKKYSPDKLLYNPSGTFGKPDVETVAEWINQDWYMPDYEVQRPAGAYIVDTEPNNTMVLAMTRAGKGNELCLAA